MTNEQKLLHLCWKKAAADGELLLPQATREQAHRMRMKLYASVKGVKSRPHLDFALADAAAECSVSLQGDSTVCIKRNDQTALAQTMFDALGITEAELAAQKTPRESEAFSDKTPENDILASQARMMALMQRGD